MTRTLMGLALLITLAWSPVVPAPVFRVIQLDMAQVCDEFQTKYSYGVCSEFPSDHANLLDIPEPKYGPWAPCLKAELNPTAEFIGA